MTTSVVRLPGRFLLPLTFPLLMGPPPIADAQSCVFEGEGSQMDCPTGFECDDACYPLKYKPMDRITSYVHGIRVRNDAPVEGALTVVFVQGIGTNATFFTPLIDELIKRMGDRLRALYSLDFPGHGDSSIPPGIKYGEMRLEHYGWGVSEALKTITAEEGAVDLYIGHSTGGLLGVLLEQALREELARDGDPEQGGLYHSYGTRGVVLLEPVPVQSIHWQFSDGLQSDAGPDLASRLLVYMVPYLTLTPDRGLVVRAESSSEWEDFFFSRWPGTEGSAVDLDDAVIAGLMEDEAGAVALQLGGFTLRPGSFLERPDVDAGIMLPYSLVTQAAEDDLYMRPDELSAFHDYLLDGPDATGEGCFEVVSAPYAVHGLPFLSPADTYNGCVEAVFQQLTANMPAAGTRSARPEPKGSSLKPMR